MDPGRSAPAGVSADRNVFFFFVFYMFLFLLLFFGVFLVSQERSSVVSSVAADRGSLDGSFASVVDAATVDEESLPRDGVGHGLGVDVLVADIGNLATNSSQEKKHNQRRTKQNR